MLSILDHCTHSCYNPYMQYVIHPDFRLRKGRDSVVVIATRYGLDDLGIECRWGKDFLHLSRQALGCIQPPIQWVSSLSRG
jgi:hypothetical protein